MTIQKRFSVEFWFSFGLVVFSIVPSVLGGASGQVSFNRDIRPILAANCFECHGHDESARKAGLRLDVPDGVFKEKKGITAIVPGRTADSEIFRRITAKDSDDLMPPPETEKSLSPEQVETIRLWIEQGAEYEDHWAFVPPQRPVIPEMPITGWARNAIDHLVAVRMEEQGLEPAPEADRYTLIRRLYLDLIGLLPTPGQADAFANDSDPLVYEKLVNRLLQSPRYGERWARPWLDLARYSDTNGYEKDRPRSIWAYRDWVIKALNDDMPFNQFTVEQIAGDMLPNATLEQKIATGFHRNTMLNEEGGIDPLEYRFYAMVDRVAATGTVWMGLTTGCAQCHSHKYDPISHRDYYSLMALLNNADEPDLIVPDKGVLERRKKILSEIEQLQNELPGKFPIGDGSGSVEERRHHRLEQSFSEWLQEENAVAVQWIPLLPNHLESNLPQLEMLEDGSTFSSGDITKRDVYTLRFPLTSVTKNAALITALKLEVLPDDRLPARGPGRAYYEGRKGDFFLSEFTARMKGQELKFKSASHSYGKISIGNGGADAANVIDGNGSTGWSTSGQEGKAHQLVLVFSEPVTPEGELEIEMLFERHFAASLGRFRISATSRTGAVSASRHPARILSLLVRGPSSLSDSERNTLKRAFLDVTSELAEAREQIEKLRKQLPEFPTTMVMLERPQDNPRLTHLHHRGEYLSPREVVSSGIPSVFVHADSENLPTNRLELARWLASRKNPLVARVTVNRAWRALFGAGLVRTSGDFGTQSDPPTHPELLDWLACEFMDQGWSLKELHRLMVSSATYRQSSNLTVLKRQQDPENRYLSRSSRSRVDAEMVRDLLLSGSGLLSGKMYGPSVYPPQPSSVTALAYGSTKWNSSTGEDRYRRSLYTFSKRTAPFAAFSVFDAPSGEICVARRDRSNTPLQALTLLNDEMFIEMARELARKAMDLELTSPDGRARDIFRRLLIRPPSESEIKALVEFQQTQVSRLSNGELNAGHITGLEQTSDEQASWVMVARVVMNLDETITNQ